MLHVFGVGVWVRWGVTKDPNAGLQSPCDGRTPAASSAGLWPRCSTRSLYQGAAFTPCGLRKQQAGAESKLRCTASCTRTATGRTLSRARSSLFSSTQASPPPFCEPRVGRWSAHCPSARVPPPRSPWSRPAAPSRTSRRCEPTSRSRPQATSSRAPTAMMCSRRTGSMATPRRSPTPCRATRSTVRLAPRGASMRWAPALSRSRPATARSA